MSDTARNLIWFLIAGITFLIGFTAGDQRGRSLASREASTALNAAAILHADAKAQTAQVSDARLCVQQLSQIDAVKEQFAMERRLQAGAPVQPADVFGPGKLLSVPPRCPTGGIYALNAVSYAPTCTVPGHAIP